MGREGLQILLLVAEEHRHGQQQRTAAGGDRRLAERERPADGRRPDTHEERAIVRQTFGGATDDRRAIGRLEMRVLPRRAADADAIDSGTHKKVHQAVESRFVKPPIVVNGRSDRREEPCHW